MPAGLSPDAEQDFAETVHGDPVNMIGVPLNITVVNSIIFNGIGNGMSNPAGFLA